MAQPAPLGDDGSTGSPKGGLRPLFCRVSLWRAAYTPRGILGGSGEAPPEFTHQLRQQMSAFQPPATRPQPQQPASAVLSSLMKAQYVYIKRGPAASSLSPLYTGPYKVVERGQKYFRLDVGGRSEAVSVDRLKPHLGASPLQPAQPPKRGRPPAATSSAAAEVGGRGRPPE